MFPTGTRKMLKEKGESLGAEGRPPTGVQTHEEAKNRLRVKDLYFLLFWPLLQIDCCLALPSIMQDTPRSFPKSTNMKCLHPPRYDSASDIPTRASNLQPHALWTVDGWMPRGCSVHMVCTHALHWCPGIPFLKESFVSIQLAMT